MVIQVRLFNILMHVSSLYFGKAAESGIVIPEQIPAGIELSEKEEGLIQMVADFAAVVKQAGEDYSPSIIANYTYDLVKEYNQFYHDYSILREENEAVKVFRIALSANVAKVVRLGMNLLGYRSSFQNVRLSLNKIDFCGGFLLYI